MNKDEKAKRDRPEWRPQHLSYAGQLKLVSHQLVHPACSELLRQSIRGEGNGEVNEEGGDKVESGQRGGGAPSSNKSEGKGKPATETVHITTRVQQESSWRERELRVLACGVLRSFAMQQRKAAKAALDEWIELREVLRAGEQADLWAGRPSPTPSPPLPLPLPPTRFQQGIVARTSRCLSSDSFSAVEEEAV